ncbi:hypothetical protein [Rhodococcus sp. 11-3]|uniref:hypothetical protein n=1 Tax=Rhodococcus sp. 11-3 TaxID=2854796 RepID=UPI002040DE64|nr:hypothetical protein [Rhodococcus sp. 11-3]USC17065.1 hypothetical protein KZJ41_09435 [Rhodococcus sp. 11-3]
MNGTALLSRTWWRHLMLETTEELYAEMHSYAWGSPERASIADSIRVRTNAQAAIEHIACEHADSDDWSKVVRGLQYDTYEADCTPSVAFDPFADEED